MAQTFNHFHLIREVIMKYLNKSIANKSGYTISNSILIIQLKNLL